MNLPRSVTIRDVGLRDGLQMLTGVIPTKEKIKLAKYLIKAGVRHLEVTSFVNPAKVPQLADSMMVVKGLSTIPGVNYSALVPNLKGMERAATTGIAQVVVVISASETHNMRNVNMSVNKSLAQIKAMTERGKVLGVKMRGAIATSFGCPFEGPVPARQVVKISRFFHEHGISEITLADTAALAAPQDVAALVAQIKREFPDITLGLHLHTPPGKGQANILAALSSGIDVLEGSIGGLGGCPFIPKAVGNVPTEEIVYTLHQMGINTGIDCDRLLVAGRFLKKITENPLTII